MRRIYIKDLKKDDKHIKVKGVEYVKLVSSLRFSSFEPVSLFNGKGMDLTGLVLEVFDDCVLIEIVGKETVKSESPLSITLYIALTEHLKLAKLVDDTVELGVTEIVFYEIKNREHGLTNSAIEKLNSTALDTVKKCKRSTVPQIKGIMPFEEIVKIPHEKKIIFDPYGHSFMKEITSTNPKDIAILIGPRGGYNKEEVMLALSNDFREVVFGPRVLKPETVAVASVTAVQTILGDMK